MMKKILLSATLLCCLSGCTLNIPPADQYSDPDAITSVQSARSLLTSAYMLYPHYEFELSVLGNDFCPASLISYHIDLKNLYLWREDKITQTAETLWLGYYNTIASCDVLLERLDKVLTGSTEEEGQKQAVYAEAKTLRALCYFQLLRLFAPAYGSNPEADGIVLKSQAGLEFPPRSSIRQCTEFIRSELKEVAGIANRPSANGWLSQQAVKYLQAEVELYAGNYGAAAAFAEEVLKQATEEMYRNNSKLWQEGHFEGRIFAFYCSGNYYTDIQYKEKEGDYFGVNPELDFSDKDNRKAYTLYPFSLDGSERMLFGKYNRNHKEGLKNTYINVMRYSGAVFIAAEAYSRTEGKEETARSRINTYLQACGAETLAASLKGASLTQAILKEKYKEFLGEGSNYFDLKRTRTVPLERKDVWGTQSVAAIAADDYRWTFPIPRSEYRYNEQVTQNEGWPRSVTN